MAYRRRHGITRSSTFKEETNRPHHGDTASSSAASAPSSPVSSHRAVGVSDARRHDSPLSSGYANSPFHSFSPHRSKEVDPTVDKRTQDIQETCKLPNTKSDTASSYAASAPSSPLSSQRTVGVSDARRHDSPLSSGYANSPFQSSSPHRSKESGPTVDKRTQDIQETCKLPNTKSEMNHEEFWKQNLWEDVRMQSAQPQTVQEHQLKATRDVAIATAAKAKLLLREIKTVKADLAFAKERSCQLEEENKILRDAREKGDHPADDDMIRLQLETLLAEKARLTHENSVYDRENSCLREIIKYHKLNMQDVVYLDEGIEEVAEVNPSISRTLSVSPPRMSFTTKETKNVDNPT